ncbi:MAG TPA: peptidoglycan DD-metalloendopeptidase family protein [Steroidobacteraceae bacterium]|nr:peptidoglycan DD-metalloendopeptidase family protein [Steroidobacteraceae bacterium]
MAQGRATRGSEIKHRRLLAALALCACAAASGKSAPSGESAPSGKSAAEQSAPRASADAGDAAQAKAKLAAVRKAIAGLTARLGEQLKQRDALNARLREADLAITSKRRRLEALNAAQLAAQRRRTDLRAEESRTRAALESQRAALAAQVRAQYMIGRADEMRLLLSQTNPAEAGRMLAYYGYFARSRAARIEEIAAHESRLAELVSDIEQTTAKLEALEEEAAREVADLTHARQERALAIAALGHEVQSGNQRLARLQQQEQAVESLLADLERVLKDFPVDTQQSFGQLRGKLPWPVQGKMTVRYQETRTNGAPTAVRLNGVLIQTARGAKVRAPYFGRVVYADWLQGMGMLLIIAHSGNFMTLYGRAEVLYKSVGDWVAPGDVIAAVSDSGAAPPQLYFEIREGRKPVDPKLWLRGAQ